MTDQEKAAHPEAEVTGAYLKKRNRTADTQDWWNSLKEHEKRAITSIPNFDPLIFREITGIVISLEKDVYENDNY